MGRHFALLEPAHQIMKVAARVLGAAPGVQVVHPQKVGQIIIPTVENEGIFMTKLRAGFKS